MVCYRTLYNINIIYKEEISEDSNHWFTFNVRKGLRKKKIMMKPNLEIQTMEYDMIKYVVLLVLITQTLLSVISSLCLDL